MIDCESETPEQELSDTSAQGSFLNLLPPKLEVSRRDKNLPPRP